MPYHSKTVMGHRGDDNRIGEAVGLGIAPVPDEVARIVAKLQRGGRQ